jgi:hypothetical protein
VLLIVEIIYIVFILCISIGPCKEETLQHRFSIIKSLQVYQFKCTHTEKERGDLHGRLGASQFLADLVL